MFYTYMNIIIIALLYQACLSIRHLLYATNRTNHLFTSFHHHHQHPIRKVSPVVGQRSRIPQHHTTSAGGWGWLHRCWRIWWVRKEGRKERRGAWIVVWRMGYFGWLVQESLYVLLSVCFEDRPDSLDAGSREWWRGCGEAAAGPLPSSPPDRY